MPLAAAKDSTLQPLIKAAFIKVMSAGEKKGADPLQIIDDLATDLATAIHSYTTQALVNTQAYAMPIVGVAAPLAPLGACPVTGVVPAVIATGTLA